MSKVKVTVNDINLEVPEGSTVMHACEMAGEEVPRFCYHDRLSIAGNCRMCLVEVEKSPKPVASCAMPVMENMIIKTDTEKVKKARKGVMEFLLINHPLDCPICDQGGECDLQDQSIYYGKSISRFNEKKRAVEEKNFGPLIKTVMTRCIHCTRCVRFMDEVAGSHELGAINRGENMEITTSIKNGLSSELSGNIIDLCPVGALTSKPYAFTARSWELKHYDSIDITDSVGSNIIVDEFGGEVKRILPKLNEEINQEWISNKARFSYDGLSNQRLDKPYLRKSETLLETNWENALNILSKKIKLSNREDIAVISGSLTDTETLFVAKNLLESLNINNFDCRANLSKGVFNNRVDYLFNSQISGIDVIDNLLIIGCDIRKETPIINARIRQRWLTGELDIKTLCVPENLNYQVDNLGKDISLLTNIDFINKINRFYSNSKFPMIIFGDRLLCSSQGKDIQSAIKFLADKNNLIKDNWNGFCFLSPNASRTGALEVGFLPKKNGLSSREIKKKIKSNDLKILILIEADDFEIDGLDMKDTFLVYIGHHGDKIANVADLIMPSTAFTEKKSLYVNLEGRPQFTSKVTNKLGMAVDSWKIFRALADKCEVKLSYNTHDELLETIYKKHPHLKLTGKIINANWKNINQSIISLKKEQLDVSIKNFYQTCSISRSSVNMANCVKEFLDKKEI